MLYKYSEQGNVQGVKVAIDQGGILPAYENRDPYLFRKMAIIKAVKLKDTSILKLLLESGVPPDESNNYLGKKNRLH